MTATLSPAFPVVIPVEEPEENLLDEPKLNPEVEEDPCPAPEVEADNREVPEPEPEENDDEPEVNLEPDDPAEEVTADDPVDVVPVDPAMKLDLIAFPEETPEAVFTPAIWKAA